MSSQSASIRLSTLPAGYVLGMGQPSAELEIALMPPEQFDAADALATMDRVFGLTQSDCPPLRNITQWQCPPHFRDALGVACGLAKHLLQVSGIPAYALEVLVWHTQATAQDERCHLYLRVPVIDHVPRQQVVAVYAKALGIAWQFTKPDDAREDAKTTADAFFDAFVLPMRAAMQYGLSTNPILREAYERGIPFVHLSRGAYMLGTGARSRLISLSSTDKDPAVSAKITGRKDQTQLILNGVGAPTPKSILVGNRDDALRAAQELGFPVVLKPTDLERSEGVFVDLATDEDVRTAFDACREMSASIVVQERIAGHCQRLVTFQNRFVFGFTRNPAGVRGDGTHSIAELIAAHNTLQAQLAKHRQSRPLPLDAKALACLQDQGFMPGQILKDGQPAYLRTINLLDYAALNEVITDSVHPDNIALVERLSRLFRMESVGFDLITTDPTRPWHETGAAITELNFQPQIGENTARSNMAAMFPAEGSAAIPVTCFVGGDAALVAARAHVSKVAADPRAVAIVSHEVAEDGSGGAYHLSGQNGIFATCEAILRDPMFDAMLVVVQTDAFLQTGTPFHMAAKVVEINTDLHLHNDAETIVSPAQIGMLMDVLKGA